MNSNLDLCRNRLLAALPESELTHWLPHLEPVDMPLDRCSTSRAVR